MIDTSNALRKELIEHYTEHLEKLHERNDSTILDIVGTSVLRGRISEVKNILGKLTEKQQRTDIARELNMTGLGQS